MADRRQWIPLIGLAATVAIAAYMVGGLNAQSASIVGDFSNAAIAEVRDASGQVVLRGQFDAVEEDGDDIERKAPLQPTGVDADASGEAEVETDKDNPATQELELSIRNVEGGATFTFVIDGRDVATVTADRNGKAEIELEVATTAGRI